MKTCDVVRKAGNTKAEALKNRTRISLEIEKLFQQKRGLDPIGSQFTEDGNPDTDPFFVENLSRRLKDAGLNQAQIDSVLHGQAEVEKQGLEYIPQPQLEAQLTAAKAGTESWKQWITKRLRAEQIAPTTQRSWTYALRSLEQWSGSEYLAGLTNTDAAVYKDLLLQQKAPSSVKAEINILSAFWRWSKTAGQVSHNIWEGQTRNLKTSKKKAPLSTEQLRTARSEADRFKDLGFWIQIYTGCRRGEHQGLRFSDLDLQNNTITFVEWSTDDIVRRLKGGDKDERTIPITTKLRKKIIEFRSEIESNNSDALIFPWSYNAPSKLFAENWGRKCGQRYGFGSHNLRSYVITQLELSENNPTILHEITRHTVPGMSKVLSNYFRPTIDQVRVAMEKLS